MSDKRRQSARKAIKMTPGMITFIKLKLKEKWSPEKVSGCLLEESEQAINYESIYLHIWADKKRGWLFKH